MAEILIVDDEENVCRIFSQAVSKLGHRADQAFSLLEGLRKVRDRPFDLVLLDVYFPIDERNPLYIRSWVRHKLRFVSAFNEIL